ncbi:hypothetical protein BB559_000246 [Furculomyces boomerangus]|uniref:Uncharacterized protein n=1 Tax=Furculomyces boomerangus TaxID=61424 RepID=A0A2T9Z5U8_9FUNG|nr:hypothetical protein BB559_000246 [Furculomyces boomerangus]
MSQNTSDQNKSQLLRNSLTQKNKLENILSDFVSYFGSEPFEKYNYGFSFINANQRRKTSSKTPNPSQKDPPNKCTAEPPKKTITSHHKSSSKTPSHDYTSSKTRLSTNLHTPSDSLGVLDNLLYTINPDKSVAAFQNTDSLICAFQIFHCDFVESVINEVEHDFPKKLEIPDFSKYLKSSGKSPEKSPQLSKRKRYNIRINVPPKDKPIIFNLLKNNKTNSDLFKTNDDLPLKKIKVDKISSKNTNIDSDDNGNSFDTSYEQASITHRPKSSLYKDYIPKTPISSGSVISNAFDTDNKTDKGRKDQDFVDEKEIPIVEQIKQGGGVYNSLEHLDDNEEKTFRDVLDSLPFYEEKEKTKYSRSDLEKFQNLLKSYRVLARSYKHSADKVREKSESVCIVNYIEALVCFVEGFWYGQASYSGLKNLENWESLLKMCKYVYTMCNPKKFTFYSGIVALLISFVSYRIGEDSLILSIRIGESIFSKEKQRDTKFTEIQMLKVYKKLSLDANKYLLEAKHWAAENNQMILMRPSNLSGILPELWSRCCLRVDEKLMSRTKFQERDGYDVYSDEGMRQSHLPLLSLVYPVSYTSNGLDIAAFCRQGLREYIRRNNIKDFVHIELTKSRF